ncbi:unnamed protein product [Hymenolepis diminuta]|uniref:Uncharacterized protein n=1 Tax=Hymenolepis diminuta TaxID=6216 RepID=A0A564YBV6_HYMDI|nr:unnamed protein product [Hymenolepis diminuta]
MAVFVRTYDGEIIRIRSDLLTQMVGLERELNDPFCATKFFVGNDNIVNLENIHSITLNQIILWHQFHRLNPQRNVRFGAKETWKLCEWDKNFFHKNDKIVINIFQAAWELEDRDLIDAAAIFIRDRLKQDPRMNAAELSKHIDKI